MYTYEEAYNATKDYFNGDELATKVSVDKYQLRDSDGNFLEKTPADIHRRLASEFARIEKHKFHNPLSEEQIFGFLDKYACIIPQGSPIFGIGNKEQIVSLSNCVHGESLVYTKEHGLIKMKDVKVGDHVLTHRNRFKKVLKHWSNGYRETYVLSRSFSNKKPNIRTEQEMGRFLAVTPEHKILKKGGGWASVNELLNKQNKSFEVPKIEYSGNIPEVFPLSNGKHILTDEDFYWLCGMYLAEGSIKKRDSNHPSVYFTLNANESEFAEKINKLSKNWFGHEAWIQKWDNYNFIQVNVFEDGFADLLSNLFGHGFNNKRLPDWMFGLEEKYIRSLLDGFLSGDGTNYESLDNPSNTFSIANPTLAYELGLLSRNINKNIRFNFLCKGKLIKNRTVNVSYSNNEDTTLFVKSPITVEVFDMEVEEDHSFVAGDFICHNCFVIQSPEDSYGGILRADQELVQISKRRGGVGIDLSTLRPNKSKTRNSSKTSTGVASWMERYSNSIREVGQDGRRGALMLTLSIHHPDIQDFINIKNDASKVTGANISVRLSDEFLKAVDNDTEYELRFPVDSPKPTYIKKIKARDIWNQIVDSAWNRAEPGLLFWDNIIRESPTDCYELFLTISTNPCQPGWAKVLTPNGIHTFENIQIGDKIWSKEGWTNVTNKVCTGIKEVYKYTTTAGIFYGTENHRLVTDNSNTKIEAKDAECIETIVGPELIDLYLVNFQDVMDGLVIGDGSCHKASNNLIGLYIGNDDQEYFLHPVKDFIIKARPGISDKFYEVKTTITDNELEKTFNRRIPDRFIYGDIAKKLSFLQGLYSANGSVCGNRITLKSSSKGLIEDVQLMLSSLGIRSYWTTNKPTKVEFNNGIYECKESYDLNISTDRDIFLRYIKFIQHYKNSSIKKVDSNRVKTVYDIISIEKISEEEVYDITVDNQSHTYWTQGVNVSNCSEIPLSAYDSCRLMSINLMSFIENAFAENAYFDYRMFYETAIIAQRLMDDLVDLELECIDKILAKIEADPESKAIKSVEYGLWQKVRKSCIGGRRTGLGTTALGDCLAAINVKYGSDESISVVDRIYQTLKFGSYRSSVDMAKELGPFPEWSWEAEKDNPFITRIKNEVLNFSNNQDCVWLDLANGYELWSDIKKYGRRNVANLTNAPTGTISTQATYSIKVKTIKPDNYAMKLYTGTSSGIEPVFKTHYTRRKKGNPGDDNFRVDFKDQNGDCWMEFPVYHKGVQAWMDVTGNTEITDDCPYNGATAEEINWIQRVKLQAAAQKHIDHAISSTINLPENVSKEEVAKIYTEAWKSGLKGITVYRDNCRTGVLITKQPEKTQNVDRPKELPCDVYHLTSKGTQYFVLIGLLDSRPYEIFAGKNGFLDKAVKSGRIIRKAKRMYKAVFDDADSTELCPITQSCSDHEETITRLTSALLRSGADIHLIVEQLEKVHGDMTSFAKIVARALKKYIKDGTKVEGEECPECHKKELVRSEGCKKCSSCGWTACL